MTPALTWLTLTLLLALVYIFAPAAVRTLKFGSAWNAGARDKDMGDPGVLAGRLLRAQANLFETLPLMIGAVLIAHVAKADPGQTALGSQLYFSRAWSTCRSMPSACPTCAASPGSWASMAFSPC